MFKRIFSYTIILAGSLLVLISCDKDDDDKITKFDSKVDVSSSSIVADKYQMTLKFSTDNGTTWVDYPIVKVGQSYQVKVIDEKTGTDATEESCFVSDWSSSNPQPAGVDGGVATFTMSSTNELIAKVTNVPFVAAAVAGKYEVVTDDWEDFVPGDVLTVQAIDDTHIRIVEYPGTSTNHAPLVITIPNPALGGAAIVASQNNGAYGATVLTTKGTGNVTCYGTIALSLDFTYTNPTGSSAGNVLELKKK
jgi:hypothetical protein